MLAYCCMSTLSEKLKSISGNKRQFVLMRVAGMDADLAMNLTHISRGTYNSWFKNEEFALIYHELPELAKEYRQEAVQMLRKGNQLEAVLLEGKIIQQLKNEIETGEYNLAKTNLAREVYSKLMTDLDVVPQVKSLTWEQRIWQLGGTPNQLTEGEKIIDAEFEEVSSEQTEHSEGFPISEGEPSSDEATQDTEV